MKIPYEEAISHSTKNRLSKYPTRADNRLEPIASPSFESGVLLKPGDKVVTMGSCFARNIEEYLGAIGIVVPVLGYNGPLEESGSRGRIQGILNKYTVASICQEIVWVKTVRDLGGTVTWEMIATMSYETPQGSWLDLQLSSNLSVSRERMIERRQAIYDIHVQMFESDLMIITPGLTEAWFDGQTGLYIQDAPTRSMANAYKGRFFLEVLDFFQCHEMLDISVRILKEGGARQIALTVSPVPLARTMTSKDVIIANMYSKSTLRSVVGLLSDTHDFVSYVPSYERVMLTKQSSVWNDDLRHVADAFVGGIVSTFAAASGHKVTNIADLLLSFNAACLAKNFQDAGLVFGEIENAIETIPGGFEAIPTFGFHKNACLVLDKIGRLDDAIRFTSIMQTLRPHKNVGYSREIDIRVRRHEIEQAKQVAITGLIKCDPSSREWLRKCIEKNFDRRVGAEILASIHLE